MLEIPGMLSWENETIISPVIEFDFFDKKVEKKTLGDIEANYKKFIYSSKEENWPIKIGYQDCIEFNDFEEASNLRATLILKDCFTQFNY